MPTCLLTVWVMLNSSISWELFFFLKFLFKESTPTGLAWTHNPEIKSHVLYGLDWVSQAPLVKSTFQSKK